MTAIFIYDESKFCGVHGDAGCDIKPETMKLFAMTDSFAARCGSREKLSLGISLLLLLSLLLVSGASG